MSSGGVVERNRVSPEDSDTLVVSKGLLGLFRFIRFISVESELRKVTIRAMTDKGQIDIWEIPVKDLMDIELTMEDSRLISIIPVDQVIKVRKVGNSC